MALFADGTVLVGDSKEGDISHSVSMTGTMNAVEFHMEINL